MLGNKKSLQVCGVFVVSKVVERKPWCVQAHWTNQQAENCFVFWGHRRRTTSARHPYREHFSVDFWECWSRDSGLYLRSVKCQHSIHTTSHHTLTQRTESLYYLHFGVHPHLPTHAPLGQEQVKDDKPYLLAANQESLQDGTRKRKEVCWAERRTNSSPEIGEGTATLLMARWRHHAASSHSR